MFVFVAVDAQQLPVAAVGGIVVVVMVAVVNGQFAHARTGELPAAAPAYPGVQFERSLAVSGFAQFALFAGFGDDAVEACVIGFFLYGHDWGGDGWLEQL